MIDVVSSWPTLIHMSDSNKSEEFYAKLKGQLEESTTWPSAYLYKFIVKTDPETIDKVEQIFNHAGAVITKSTSKTKKYTSVSINVVMKNPDAVIAKYKEVASKVEDVISL